MYKPLHIECCNADKVIDNLVVSVNQNSSINSPQSFLDYIVKISGYNTLKGWAPERDSSFCCVFSGNTKVGRIEAVGSNGFNQFRVYAIYPLFGGEYLTHPIKTHEKEIGKIERTAKLKEHVSIS